MTNIYEGQVLILETIDKCNLIFSKDCKITFSEKVPVYFGSSFSSQLPLGTAEIFWNKKGISCRVVLNDEKYNADEYFIGGYYINVKSHVEHDSDDQPIQVIDGGHLRSITIFPESQVADKNLKIRKVKE